MYLPVDLLIIFKSLCFILLFIKPKFSCIFSTNESLGPLTAGSDSGVFMLLAKSALTSRAYISLLFFITIAKAFSI